MADSVKTLQILDAPHKLVLKLTNVSDGTGESAVDKVVLSSYTGVTQPPNPTKAPTSVIIEKIEYSITNPGGSTATVAPSVTINADGTTPVRLAVLTGQGSMHLEKAAGLNSANTGTNAGNVSFTTNHFVSGSTYDITLYMRKVGG